MSEVGTSLREAREAQGLDIAEVARRTRVPIRHLAAIEQGEHAGLPAATYSAGFVRTYARLLGLDGHALSQRFREELAPREQSATRYEPLEPADPARTPSRLLVWSTLALAVLALVGFLYWRGVTLADNPARLAADSGDATPATRPAARAVAAPPAAAKPAPVTLLAQQPAWLRVYEMAGGRKLFEGLLEPGRSFVVPADAADPRLLTSRPNVLRVTVGDQVVPPLGPPERRIKDVSLRPAALLARLGTGEAASAAPIAAAPGAPVAVENSAGPE